MNECVTQHVPFTFATYSWRMMKLLSIVLTMIGVTVVPAGRLSEPEVTRLRLCGLVRLE